MLGGFSSPRIDGKEYIASCTVFRVQYLHWNVHYLHLVLIFRHLLPRINLRLTLLLSMLLLLLQPLFDHPLRFGLAREQVAQPDRARHPRGASEHRQPDQLLEPKSLPQGQSQC